MKEYLLNRDENIVAEEGNGSASGKGLKLSYKYKSHHSNFET